MERRNIEVPRGHAGEAVARVVHDGLGVAHSIAKGMIDEGCVTINGRPARTHGQRCAEGDVVEVRFDPNRRYHPQPTPRHGLGFQVLHEDRDIVVVDKMPGILSSPAPGVAEESLAERIAASLKDRGIKKPQLFVVHRLDRHTSGLLVFAKSQRALESLTAQFESREARRLYATIVDGRVRKERGTIISHLAEDPKTLSVRTTPLRGAGKRAVTHFEVTERFENATLVRVKLETGRKHQIRIHFAEIGHSVLGDRRYGHASPLIQRVALHAQKLMFKHPTTHEQVVFEAPSPEDLKRALHQLRKAVSGDDAGDSMGVAVSGSETFERAAPRVTVFPKGLVLLDPVGGAFEQAPTTSTQGHSQQASPGVRAAHAAQTSSRPDNEHERRRLARERIIGDKAPFREPPRRDKPLPRGFARPEEQDSSVDGDAKRPGPQESAPHSFTRGRQQRAGRIDADDKRPRGRDGAKPGIIAARASTVARVAGVARGRGGEAAPVRRDDRGAARNGGGEAATVRRDDRGAARGRGGDAAPGGRDDRGAARRERPTNGTQGSGREAGARTSAQGGAREAGARARAQGSAREVGVRTSAQAGAREAGARTRPQGGGSEAVVRGEAPGRSWDNRERGGSIRPVRENAVRQEAARAGASSQEGAKRASPAGKSEKTTVANKARKPWEFRQKGMTLRRERRKKIATAAKARRKKD